MESCCQETPHHDTVCLNKNELIIRPKAAGLKICRLPILKKFFEAMARILIKISSYQDRLGEATSERIKPVIKAAEGKNKGFFLMSKNKISKIMQLRIEIIKI